MNYIFYKSQQNDLNEFTNIDLMHELREKMIREFKTSTKELTPNQKEDRMLEIRDQFIPEKKQKLLESSHFSQNNKNIKK